MYCVYILANWNNKFIYTGGTSNLISLMYEHKNKLVDGFTKKYNIDKFVNFDDTTDVKATIEREKQIKGWTRQKKNELIEAANPKWEDLFERLYKKKDSSLRSE